MCYEACLDDKGLEVSRRISRTIMGLDTLQPVRAPALARFLQLPIPCVLSTHNTIPVYIREPLLPIVARRGDLQVQALRLLSM
jgi:hypothetical protein